MSPEAIHGEGGAYVPCEEMAAPLPPLPRGAIVGQAAGFVARDQVAAGLPETPQGAIRGSQVGFVPAPCECEPVGPGDGVFKTYKRYTPKVYSVFGPPIGPTIDSTSGGGWPAGSTSPLQADGRGREGTIQFNIPALMTLRVNIEVYVYQSYTTNNAGHPRCFTNIPFQWELRRANWGASFTPTYDDFQLDPSGSILGGGTVMPTNLICYPWPTYPGPTQAESNLHLLSYTDDLTPDINGKIQFQLRISDLDADAAAQYNNFHHGSGSFAPGSEAEWDDWLYSHQTIRTTVTVCEP